MAGDLRHGFKAEAERLSLSIRAEFGLAPFAPIDCAQICGELGIPVVTVPDLVASGAALQSIRRILAPNAKFSAMTVAAGTHRLIVYNPKHPAGRRANSLAHELSHILSYWSTHYRLPWAPEAAGAGMLPSKRRRTGRPEPCWYRATRHWRGCV